MTEKVEVVVKHAAKTVGEGPHWVDKTQSLLYVDIFSNDLHHWNPATNKTSSLHFDEYVTLVVPTEKDDEYIISQGSKLAKLQWSSKKVEVLHEAGAGVRYNDGKCDPRGRLLAGTMGLETAPAVLPPGMGNLYSLDIQGKVTKLASNITLSNGLAWTADTKKFYFIDSTPRKVYLFDYNADNGQATNQRTVIDFADYDDLGLPDGMAIDTEDKIWIACYSAGKVVRFDPETKKLLKVVKIDAKQTTSVCFGGPNLDELYVTSAAMGLTEEELKAKDPLAGSIFKVTGLGVKGYPAVNYKG
ncbi:hypothetical protein LOTGIDRAFT_207903 [Lottia gigantea]|uniref:Regucalcin n=1 Tax=Lottia gigantea TaxID=225164 RepID=V4C5A2_LOTGI|nr:hypothetical protein LOTGIDRAFT_207903 [Lottia gigantea]ESO96769.1 hypothetical protein LOTGIDRAFT_207903 [Lottia gigantea]